MRLFCVFSHGIPFLCLRGGKIFEDHGVHDFVDHLPLIQGKGMVFAEQILVRGGKGCIRFLKERALSGFQPKGIDVKFPAYGIHEPGAGILLFSTQDHGNIGL